MRCKEVTGRKCSKFPLEVAHIATIVRPRNKGFGNRKRASLRLILAGFGRQ